MQSFFTKLS